VREEVNEVMFEKENEKKYIYKMIIDEIIKCKIDMRKKIDEKIMVIGGKEMDNGFKERIMNEMNKIVKKKKYE
jgi:actin-related protein